MEALFVRVFIMRARLPIADVELKWRKSVSPRSCVGDLLPFSWRLDVRITDGRFLLAREPSLSCLPAKSARQDPRMQHFHVSAKPVFVKTLAEGCKLSRC